MAKEKKKAVGKGASGTQEQAKKEYKYKRKSLTIGKKADGTPDRIWVRGATSKELEENYQEAKRMHARGLARGEMTVYEWSRLWMGTYKANATENQRDHYMAKLNLDILPAIGSMRVMDVRKSHLQGILNSYSGGRKGTVEKIRIAVRQLFADALEEGLIERDPATRVVLPEMEEEARRPLTCVERMALLSAASAHPCGPFMLTLYYCGLRKGECAALTRGDVDLERRRLVVSKAVDRKGGITTTKADKLRKKRSKKSDNVGTRVVPIPNLLLEVLATVCEGKSPGCILFPKTGGGYATRTTLDWWWKSFSRRCHIASGAKLYRNAVRYETSTFGAELTPHYLRHTYATDIYAAGVDDKARHEFMGHASGDVTDIYTKMTDEAFKRALSLIDGYHTRAPWCEFECANASRRWASLPPDERERCGGTFSAFLSSHLLARLVIHDAYPGP